MRIVLRWATAVTRGQATCTLSHTVREGHCFAWQPITNLD